LTLLAGRLYTLGLLNALLQLTPRTFREPGLEYRIPD